MSDYSDGYDSGFSDGYDQGKEIGYDEILDAIEECDDMGSLAKLLRDYGRD